MSPSRHSEPGAREFSSGQETSHYGSATHQAPPGSMGWRPATQHPELLAPHTHEACAAWAAQLPAVAQEVQVAEIDPEASDTAAMSDTYGIPLHMSVNCVLVAGRREGAERAAAVAVRASGRADVNGAIRRLLAVRKASFVPVDRAVHDSGMEYGGITPIGLGWHVLLDAEIAADPDWVIIGSGLRHSKIALPGTLLAQLPGIHVEPDLSLR